MKYGTYLGIFWAIMYILLLKFYANPILSLAAVAMFISSPFLACRLASNYRKQECGNSIRYPQACIIDQGQLMMDINVMLSQIIATPGIDEASKMQFESMREIISELTIKDVIWQLLNNNIFNSLTLPPIIALFVRKTS